MTDPATLRADMRAAHPTAGPMIVEIAVCCALELEQMYERMRLPREFCRPAFEIADRMVTEALAQPDGLFTPPSIDLAGPWTH